MHLRFKAGDWRTFHLCKNGNVFGKAVSNFNLLLFLIQLQYQFSKMQHQQKIGNFIAKLNYLLSNAEYSEIICWDKTETMIDILSFDKMEKEIIPLYFRHHKFESFVRQLNLYGFKKVKINGRHRFTHPQLLKGDKLSSITSHKSGNAKKEQKDQLNDHLSHQKTSESAANNGNREKVQSPILNSITQDQAENIQGLLNPLGGMGRHVLSCQDQSQLLNAYSQQFYSYWNMLMMHSSTPMGGYILINHMRTEQ